MHRMKLKNNAAITSKIVKQSLTSFFLLLAWTMMVSVPVRINRTTIIQITTKQVWLNSWIVYKLIKSEFVFLLFVNFSFIFFFKQNKPELIQIKWKLKFLESNQSKKRSYGSSQGDAYFLFLLLFWRLAKTHKMITIKMITNYTEINAKRNKKGRVCVFCLLIFELN